MLTVGLLETSESPYSVLRKALLRVGMDGLRTDYVAWMLADHYTGRGARLPSAGENGRYARTVYVVDMLGHLAALKRLSKFRSHASQATAKMFLTECADEVLGTAGVFGQFIVRRQSEVGAPPMQYFEDAAAMFYGMAADMRPENGLELQQREISDTITETREQIALVFSEYWDFGTLDGLLH